MQQRILSSILLPLAAISICTSLSGAAFAQAWPNKPIRFIVPFAAGGLTDVVARIVSPKLSEALGQPIIIENKGGAGGTLGTAQGAKAAPDGYTFVVPAASHTTTPSLYTRLDFDPIKDFVPVTQIAVVPYVLVVPASVAMRTLDDLIAAAKAKPGTLTYGSAGNGSSNHLAGELFATAIGAPLVHVPYKGSAPALTDVLGGQLTFMFDGINTSAGFVKAGRLRVLGIGTTKRSKIMPDVAPIADTLPRFEALTWVGLLAPAGTPKDIVTRMQREIEKVVQSPEVQAQLSASGAEAVASTPEQFGAYMTSEIEKWTRVVKQANIPAVD